MPKADGPVAAPKHRFFVPPERTRGGEVAFSPDQARQMSAVLRLTAGARVRVFDGVAPRDHVVELVSLSRAGATGSVRASAPCCAEPRTWLAAYPSLLPRAKFEQVLQKLVEVGASAVTPVLSARALVREAPDRRHLERWAAIAREAAEQSGRAIVPAVRPAQPLGLALGQARAAGTALLAYEGERALGVRQALADPRPGAVSLFVGPEGGYAPEEVALARQVGVRVVTLGPRTLRAETASPVLAALVLHELG